MRTAYDRLLYPTAPQAFAYPAAFGALAQLCGAPPPPARGYRALEIGCGDGAHLMAMALDAPESGFFGFDLAQTAIERAQALARDAGLDGVEFAQRDILDHGLAPRSFDYVVAHGVYAWTPPLVRDAALALIGHVLSPNGVAVVSFNVLPGCDVRLRLRARLLPAVSGEPAPHRKIERARDELRRIAAAGADADLVAEARVLLDKDPAILFHDDLGEVYAPTTVSDFTAAAAAHGLDHLCDSDPGTLASALSSDGPASEADWLAQEARRDASDRTRFRRAILVRSVERRDRRFQVGRLAGLFACADLSRDGARAWRTPQGGRIATDDAPVAQFLDALSEAGARGAPLDELSAGFDARTDALLRLVLAGVVSLRTRPTSYAVDPPERPCASPLARAQARTGRKELASLRGGEVELGDANLRAFLDLLDGARSRADLAEAMARKLGATARATAPAVEAALRDFARMGLLRAVN